MEFNSEEIHRFWEPYYLDNAILLKSARLDYPDAYGTFRSAGGSLYLKGLEHMTAVELLVCLNQLSALSVKKWCDAGFFGNLQLDWEKAYLASCLMKLKGVISPSDEIRAKLHLRRLRRIKDTTFFAFGYSFNDDRFYGDALFGVKQK